MSYFKEVNIDTDTFEFGYILGACLGDGSISTHIHTRNDYKDKIYKQRIYTIGLSATDKDFCEFFNFCLYRLLGKKYTICKTERRNEKRKNMYYTVCHLKNFYVVVKRYCDQLSNLDIPEKSDVKEGILSGLFDSDGSVKQNGLEFFKDLQTIDLYRKICEDFNIPTKLHRRSNSFGKYYVGVYGYWNIKAFRDHTKLAIDRKRRKIDENLNRCKRRNWSDTEIEYLKNNFKHQTYKIIGEALGRSEGVVKLKASELGLKKYA